MKRSLAAGIVFTAALAGACGEAPDYVQNVRVFTSSHSGTEAHFGVRGSAFTGYYGETVTAHVEASCIERGVQDPVIRLVARTAIGDRQRFEAPETLRPHEQFDCTDVADHVSDQQAVDYVVDGLVAEERQVFGNGQLIHGDVNDFHAGLLQAAETGKPVR
jgi:hypothetical protein